jgi:propionyl-CoA carboxylase beta chain
MGPEGAAEVIWAKEIASAADPAAARQKFIAEYEKNYATPYLAAGLRVIDDIIDPAETRIKIIRGLKMLDKKHASRSPRKHGIMPV